MSRPAKTYLPHISTNWAIFLCLCQAELATAESPWPLSSMTSTYTNTFYDDVHFYIDIFTDSMRSLDMWTSPSLVDRSLQGQNKAQWDGRGEKMREAGQCLLLRMQDRTRAGWRLVQASKTHRWYWWEPENQVQGALWKTLALQLSIYRWGNWSWRWERDSRWVAEPEPEPESEGPVTPLTTLIGLWSLAEDSQRRAVL